MTENWRRHAECAREDPSLFDPTALVMTSYHKATAADKHASPVFDAIRRAKEICGRCAVSAACLAEAQDDDIPVGIWGGLTVNERRLYKRRAAKNSRSA